MSCLIKHNPSNLRKTSRKKVKAPCNDSTVLLHFQYGGIQQNLDIPQTPKYTSCILYYIDEICIAMLIIYVFIRMKCIYFLVKLFLFLIVINLFTLQRRKPPIEIWPFRFLTGVHIFIFLQIANLAVQIFIFLKKQI